MPLRRPPRLAPAAALVAAVLGGGAPLHAQPEPPLAAAPAPAAVTSEGRRAIILRTVIEERGQRRLPSADEPELQAMAQMLDGLLGDTAQDLGLSVDLTERSVPDPSRLEESDLTDEARKLDGVLVAPVLAPEGR